MLWFIKHVTIKSLAKFLFCCAVKEAHRVSHSGRSGTVRSGKLEGRGGQHFSLLEILSSSRRTHCVRNIFEFAFLKYWNNNFTRYLYYRFNIEWHLEGILGESYRLQVYLEI